MGEEIMQLLLALNRDRGITVIMVTHDAHCAACAQHQVVFRDGRIVKNTRGVGPS
jgi:putative ABC transport system ATP-binding protein